MDATRCLRRTAHLLVSPGTHTIADQEIATNHAATGLPYTYVSTTNQELGNGSREAVARLFDR